jgi:Fe-Mn family superoxide dismutase
MLRTHFTLYQGYVTATNALAEKRSQCAPNTPEYAELTRRFGWEFNGMRLHELYFSNMSKEPQRLADDSPVKKAIIASFGSVKKWRDNFTATAAMRGVGWVILSYDAIAQRLFNVWINEHDVGHLAGTIPLLVMDVFEHAFMSDYGLRRADYITAFMNAIHWDEVQWRFEMV